MKAIPIGLNSEGNGLFLTPEVRRSTHMHVIGGSGTGKSKFLEWIIRKDIREGHGFCLVDWHGTLYADVLRYCAHLEVGLHNDFRKVILLNPSQPDFVTGFNPFMNQGADISVQVRRRIDATIRPWGITDTNQMPTFENVMYALYTFAVEQRETLGNAAQLLEFDKPELREYAARIVRERQGQRQLRRLVQTKTFREWRDFVLSTENRLGRFLGSQTVRRFMGLTDGNLDLLEAMDQGHIVLINLGSSGYLDREAARVFASLLLNEFFETAMLRATEAEKLDKKPSTYMLYLDEFQEYITDDIGSMLDQVRKGGLHMVLAHQHLGHLATNVQLLKSILTNARVRAVFGGLDFEDASLLSNEMFLPDLNTRQLKAAYYHTIHLYEEQSRNVRSLASSKGVSAAKTWNESKTSGRSTGSGYSESSGSTFGSGTSTAFTIPGTTLGSQTVVASDFSSNSESGGFSEFSSESSSESSSKGGSRSRSKSTTEGESVIPVWVPVPIQELGSETEWSREEKLSKAAEMLKTQQQRHCFIKLDTERTQSLEIPFVEEYSVSRESLLEYENETYKAQGALPASDVDQLVEENEKRFLLAASQQITQTDNSIDVKARTAPLEKKKLPSRRKSARQSLFSKIKEEF
jgi:hypothetical protein